MCSTRTAFPSEESLETVSCGTHSSSTPGMHLQVVGGTPLYAEFGGYAVLGRCNALEIRPRVQQKMR